MGRSSLRMKARPSVVTEMEAATAFTEPSIITTCITPPDRVVNRVGSHTLGPGWIWGEVKKAVG